MRKALCGAATWSLLREGDPDSPARIFERFAVMAAGKRSANDPKYVVEPQRARLAAREAASASP